MIWYVFMTVVIDRNFRQFNSILNFWPYYIILSPFLTLSIDRTWKFIPMDKIWHWNNIVFMPNADKYNEKRQILSIFPLFDSVAHFFANFWVYQWIEHKNVTFNVKIWRWSNDFFNKNFCEWIRRYLQKWSILLPLNCHFILTGYIFWQ